MGTRPFTIFNSLKLIKNPNIYFITRRFLTVLGIETSCDDTAVAIVKDNGLVLGHSAISQQNLHLKYGGISPLIAQTNHRKNIEKVWKNCLETANVEMKDIDAIAVTNRPGLELSLTIGVRFAKHLSRTYNKPVVPIHHMEAHALAVRMTSKVEFPYLCLLVSGGHCQLVWIKGPSQFYLLGETLDDAPGEAFDKIARALKLRNIPEYEWFNGGAAIEMAARQAKDVGRFEFALPLARYRDCQFSFAGMKNIAKMNIKEAEKESGTRMDEVIPHYHDFCAGLLKAITKHLCHRTQRAFEFCKRKAFFSPDASPDLVISGGVACNDYIFNAIQSLGDHFKMNTFRPPKKYCSDNGAMIAWDAIEKMKENSKNCFIEADKLKVFGKCSLGVSLINDVKAENIACKWAKIKYGF